ncbi:unnamed protein product [marine sediment metagenome]|uniref:Uncharacterized protein n=1 Tax=marine sediment metagenome TaxID=412755 RepID=X0Z5E9_9ZZZZ
MPRSGQGHPRSILRVDFKAIIGDLLSSATPPTKPNVYCLQSIQNKAIKRVFSADKRASPSPLVASSLAYTCTGEHIVQNMHVWFK